MGEHGAPLGIRELSADISTRMDDQWQKVACAGIEFAAEREIMELAVAERRTLPETSGHALFCVSAGTRVYFEERKTQNNIHFRTITL